MDIGAACQLLQTRMQNPVLPNLNSEDFPDELRQQGQVLDIERSATPENACTDSADSAASESTDDDRTLDAMSVEDVRKEFDKIQCGRVATYKDFNKSFKEMARSSDFSAYQDLGSRVTKSFAKLSSEVNQIESSLRSRGMEEQANVVREIQENEKQKLQLTVAHQLDLHKLATLKAAASDFEEGKIDGRSFEETMHFVEKSISHSVQQQEIVTTALNELISNFRRKMVPDDDDDY